jgi:hypothetical protein
MVKRSKLDDSFNFNKECPRTNMSMCIRVTDKRVLARITMSKGHCQTKLFVPTETESEAVGN